MLVLSESAMMLTFSLIIQGRKIEVIYFAYLFDVIDASQGVTKRCRLPLLTNSALVYAIPNAGGWWVAGSQPMSKAVHIT